MKKADFDKLTQAIKDVTAYARGKATAEALSIRVTTHAAIDPALIRESMSLTRGEFATMLGVSARVLQSWEQGARAPSGAARSLLTVAAYNPALVFEALTGRQAADVRVKPAKLPAQSRSSVAEVSAANLRSPSENQRKASGAARVLSTKPGLKSARARKSAAAAAR